MAAKLATRPRDQLPRSRRGASYLARRRRVGYLLVLPALIALALVAIYPLLYNLVLSSRFDVATEPGTQHFVGMQNYHSLVVDPAFWGDLLHTGIFVVISVTLEFVAGMILALVVNRKFRARGLVRASILIPWAIPTAVSALLWKMFFDIRSGFVDFALSALHLPGAQTVWFNSPVLAWVPIILSDMWKNTPFIALLLLAGLQTIPQEIYESAKIDGASSWQAFWSLTLPLLRPAILVALIFRTLSAMLVFDTIFVMTGGGPGQSTEVIAYYNWYKYMVSLNFGYGAAVAVVITILALLLAGIYVRILRQREGFVT
ncbi:MAG: sugar ABC transporter permease [Firmicutes bacterium]|jgi:multiple sugar transport system permease protein|uniref:ABC transporter permease n=1 Tax=Sulfobacillus benefaciens TaxID=453960 RepID=A0A2T2X4A7_9FIRM|nr:sugar ABC transporter permease [Bacillota bacterium]MCL5013968.1 sugar ABC transporter permease [Bacillota bacterium]PSR29330.1 MAG: ABC transporter permease [Sulfobacillus benefaciens]